MRVLTVGNLYPPHHLGGYELVWESAVRYLRASGHQIRVLATSFELPDRRSRSSDPEVFRELDWYWRDGEWPRFSLRRRLRLEGGNARVLERHLRDWRPDVVCWWAMGGMSLSLIERVRGRGLPAAFVVCDDWLLYAPQVDGWTRAMRRLGAAAAIAERVSGIPASLDLDRAGQWLFASATLRSRALEAGWRLEGSVVCHQGVDKRMFSPAPQREWRWRLAYVGRIDPRKGIDLAILALEHLPAASRLAIVGRGDDRHLAELRALVRARGLDDRVSFDAMDREDLRDVYADADAILFPVRWREPWGLVPLEAMAVGTPVIATGRGGSGEYLRAGENCLLFEPDDGPEALAAALRRLAGDGALRSRLRAGGFETTSRFGAHDFDRAVAALVERVVG
jgi:glycogen(starch) synthase